MAIYTLKNRFAGEPYTGTFDSQQYVVVDTLAVPDYVAVFLKEHAVIRDNPISGEREFRLGILELGDDISPLGALPLESFDRSDTDFPKAEIRHTAVKPTPPVPRGSGRETHVMTTKERGA